MRLLPYATAFVVLLSVALPAAASADAVTLSAPHQVKVGKAVHVTGAVSPAAPGERVQVVDAKGAVLASPTVDAAGRYATTLRARPGLALTARWRAVASARRSVAVLPRLASPCRAARSSRPPTSPSASHRPRASVCTSS